MEVKKIVDFSGLVGPVVPWEYYFVMIGCLILLLGLIKLASLLGFCIPPFYYPEDRLSKFVPKIKEKNEDEE